MTDIITTRTPEIITSMEAAQMIGKEHSKLLRDIRRYIKQLNEVQVGSVEFFYEDTYVDAKGETRPCYNVTRKGCDFIANKLTGQKGTEFTAKYVNRFHELEENNVTTSLINTLRVISDSMLEMKREINSRLTKLEEKQNIQSALPENTYKKPYNPWFAKMCPKYELLEEYFDVDRGQLYKNILMELENLYDLDTQQICADYCYENNISSCYPLEPYEFNLKYREMIESIVNSNLIKFGIAKKR